MLFYTPLGVYELLKAQHKLLITAQQTYSRRKIHTFQILPANRVASIPGIGIGPIPAIFDGIGIGDYVI